MYVFYICYEYFDKNLTISFFYFTGCQRRKNLGCGHAEIEANNTNNNKKVVKKEGRKQKQKLKNGWFAPFA